MASDSPKQILGDEGKENKEFSLITRQENYKVALKAELQGKKKQNNSPSSINKGKGWAIELGDHCANTLILPLGLGKTPGEDSSKPLPGA